MSSQDWILVSKNQKKNQKKKKPENLVAIDKQESAYQTMDQP